MKRVRRVHARLHSDAQTRTHTRMQASVQLAGFLNERPSLEQIAERGIVSPAFVMSARAQKKFDQLDLDSNGYVAPLTEML